MANPAATTGQAAGPEATTADKLRALSVELGHPVAGDALALPQPVIFDVASRTDGVGELEEMPQPPRRHSLLSCPSPLRSGADSTSCAGRGWPGTRR